MKPENARNGGVPNDRDGAVAIGTAGLLRWPKSRFFFAVLDVAPLPKRARNDPRRLGFLFEAELPVPIEEVAAAYAPLPGARVLACGIEKDALRRELPRGIIALVPDGVPDLRDLIDPADPVGPVGPANGEPGEHNESSLDHRIDPAALNVLTGEFEPETVSRLRRRSRVVLAAAILTAACLVVIGVESRLNDLRARRTELAVEEGLLLDAALGKVRVPVAIEQRRVQLLGEKRKLERTRRPSIESASGADAADVADTLASLLAKWPSVDGLEVESMRIDRTGADVRGTAKDASGVSELAAALAGVEGLRLEQPKLHTAADGTVRFEASLHSPQSTSAPGDRR